MFISEHNVPSSTFQHNSFSFWMPRSIRIGGKRATVLGRVPVWICVKYGMEIESLLLLLPLLNGRKQFCVPDRKNRNEPSLQTVCNWKWAILLIAGRIPTYSMYAQSNGPAFWRNDRPFYNILHNTQYKIICNFCFFPVHWIWSM